MPSSAKWIADLINRVGFPVFAFCVLAYILFIKVNRWEERSNENNLTLMTSIDKNTQAITALRHFLTHKYDD